MSMREAIILFWRGLRLRCPNCGKGKLFRHSYTMYDRCASCGWVFEREEGYWTGAMAINLVTTELLLAAFAVPLSIIEVPVAWLLGIGIPVAVALPFLFYWHAKSLWMSLDFLLHPASAREPLP